MTDWVAIKGEYITTSSSANHLAEKYGVSRSTITRKAKKEEWQELREQFHNKTQQKTEEIVISSASDRAEKLCKLKEKIIALVSDRLEDGEISLADLRKASLIVCELADREVMPAEAVNPEAVEDVRKFLEGIAEDENV